MNVSQVRIREDKEPAVAFNSFRADREYGINRDRLQFQRLRNRDFPEVRKLSLRDASTMFYNFYGIEVNVQIKSAAGADTTDSEGNVRGQNAKIQTTMCYQTPVSPYARHQGGSPQALYVTPDNDPNRFYTSMDVYLASVVDRTSMFFSQNPPTDSDIGFMGFGVKDLCQINFNAVTSRWTGGALRGSVTIGSNEVDRRDAPGSAQKVWTGEKYETFYVFDGSYQEYLNSKTYEHPDLRPVYEYTYKTETYQLKDNQGTVIPLRKTTAYYSLISKRPKYKYNSATGRSDIVGALSTHPPQLVSADFIGKGLFYNYSGFNTIYPSPVLRLN